MTGKKLRVDKFPEHNMTFPVSNDIKEYDVVASVSSHEIKPSGSSYYLCKSLEPEFFNHTLLGCKRDSHYTQFIEVQKGPQKLRLNISFQKIGEDRQKL